jgi:hypothetical protein
VPIAADVDCPGGSGPAYVTGHVRVIGTDADHNGIGCE